MKKCVNTSKLGLWVEFFVVTVIDIHQLNLGLFGTSKFLVENSLKICVFFIFFSNKSTIFNVFKEKSIPNEKQRYFIVGHCIIFSNFFCLVMSYEP
jgi:hypothetical protein